MTCVSIKQSIAALEFQSCTLADCFLGLAKLERQLKIYQSMNIVLFVNSVYDEFADPIILIPIVAISKNFNEQL
ncbi:hypothetical protein RirG_058920 [Rhizophagus irregularis DAOM 197198w]|uniref:Uncharacterized protein n=1 Tax=Rhizophagus irregularis (strain DAOM 197198w) TaxID=1432141 RepID=A0A015N3A2_RHIIW|nr:hypothetical protein RirG_058920 [Rhizophagus irregularis DAOM 197198w]